MTNKEVIEKLREYFREHADFETLARALANLMIDNHRLINYLDLPSKERSLLNRRMRANDEMLTNFIKNGGKEKFCLNNIQSS
jgi:hypothetical protein